MDSGAPDLSYELYCRTDPRVRKAWDASSLSVLFECERKFDLLVQQGWSSEGGEHHTVFGSAYHAGLQAYEEAKLNGRPKEEAIEDALLAAFNHYANFDDEGVFTGYTMSEDKAKTLYTCLRALVWYADVADHEDFETVRLANGRPAVEVSFRLPLPDWCPSPDGDPYILCGHIDRVARNITEPNGPLYVIDYKTTKSALTSFWLKQYNPNIQAFVYDLAAPVLFPDQPFRGVIFDVMQTGVTFSRFTREPIHRTDEQREEFLRVLMHKIEQATEAAQAGHWFPNYSACMLHGGCRLRDVCKKTPGLRDNFLSSNFTKGEPWNPLINRS